MARVKKDRYGLRGEVHFQMAPLIDVVFLLLIFFICVTNFDKIDRDDLALAYAETAKEYIKDDTTLIVQVRPDGSVKAGGFVYLKEAKLKLQGYLQNIVDTRGPDFKVAIRADRKARMREIKDVYRACAHVGLTRISLITETRESPQIGPGGPIKPGGEEEIADDDLIY